MNRNRLRGLIAAIVAQLAGISVVGQTIRLQFDFTGADPARHLPWTRASARDSRLTTDGWSFGAGLSLAEARDDRLAFSVTSDATASSLEQARASNAFLSLRIAASEGALDLSGNRFQFTIRREGWHAPLQYAVFCSVDGYGAPLFTSPLLESSDDTSNSFTFLAPQTGFGGIAGPVEFRIYPFAARYAGHAASLTGFSISMAAQIHRLSLSSTRGGVAKASPDLAFFESGDNVVVTALAEPGFRFVGWRGPTAGTGNPAHLNITAETSVTALFAPQLPPQMDLGGNLDSLADWSTAWVFKDCFRLARTWMTRNADGSGEWNTGLAVPSDAEGWPLSVPFNPPGNRPPQRVHTVLPLHGPGSYTVRLRGTGRIELVAPNGGGRRVLDATGGAAAREFDFNPDLQDRMLYLEIVESALGDPVRGIEIISPGQDTNLKGEPFHPAFLKTLSPYRVLRFMDWLQINWNPPSRWSDRTIASSCTQTGPGGVAHEYIILLANQTRRNPWICIPHDADDGYVREVARLYRDTLQPELEVYVEYSNETWNGGFPQTTHVQEKGHTLGLDSNRWRAGQRYVARRSAEIFGIFAGEYGEAGRHRFVAVLATQAAGATGVTDLRVSAMNDPAINPSRHQPDVLAIAPYFGVNYEPGSPLPTAESLVTTISREAITEAVFRTKAHRDIADFQGWRLVCYEGGQHFVGILGAENTGSLTEILHQANRDPRMHDRYREYLTALQDAGVDLFVNFTHIGEWSKWGSWGALEHQEQNADEAPKWRALRSWATDLGSRHDPTAVIPGGQSDIWLLRPGLRPDRRYAIQSSDNLVDWIPVPGLQALRGSGIAPELSMPQGTNRFRFWRVRVIE